MPVPSPSRLTFQSVISSSRNAAAGNHSQCLPSPQASPLGLYLLHLARPNLLLLRPARRPLSSTTSTDYTHTPPPDLSTRYIPPHLSSGFPSPVSPLPRSESHTLSQITAHYNLTSGHGTLNPSSPSSSSSSSLASQKLAFVLVFTGQHPDWESEGEVLCKNHLELLSPAPTAGSGEAENTKDASKAEGQEASSSETALPTHPVPIFTELFRSQVRQQRSRPRLSHQPPRPADPRFRFAGYYRVKAVRYLEPRSPALEAMLERKFAPRERKGRKESWVWVKGERVQSLEAKWAVMGFERVNGEEAGGWEDPLREMTGVGWEEDEVDREREGEGAALKGILEWLRLGARDGGKG
ncbi:MAG: hypothetical protein Q9184_000646 [Pyrenodesmia sp. 2 TL-2023]